MKTGWIAGAVLACVAAGLLLLFTRGSGTGPDEAAPPNGPAARLARQGDGAAPGAMDRGGGGRLDAIGGGARERRAAGSAAVGAGGTRPGGGLHGDGAPVPDGADRAPRAGSVGGAGPNAAGTIDASLAAARPPTEREAPQAGSTGPVDAFNANANAAAAAAEPIPDVAYDGGLDTVFPTDSQEEVADAGPIAGGAGTVSFWLKPEWAAGDQNDATFIQLGDSGLEVMKNVSFLRFQYTDSAGVEHGLGSSLEQWPPGEWRHVAASWVNGQLTLYVDGKMVSQDRYQTPPEFQAETKLYVGSAFASGAPASAAQITGLRVLNRDAGAGEIGAQFHAGAPPAR